MRSKFATVGDRGSSLRWQADLNRVRKWPTCMAIAPRMAAGEISAARTGTVLDFGPIPRPRKSRLMKRCHQLFVTAPPANETETSTSVGHGGEGGRARQCLSRGGKPAASTYRCNRVRRKESTRRWYHVDRASG